MQKLMPLMAFMGLTLASFLSATPAHAQATRTWVSGVGDDTNPCSRTTPCRTFARAITQTAVNGEINCLDPGGFGPVTISKSITIDCHEIFASIFNAGAIGINIQFDSLDISNSRISNNGVGVRGGGGGGIIRLANNGISFNRTGLIGPTTSFGNNRISGNAVAGTAPTAAGPISNELGQQ